MNAVVAEAGAAAPDAVLLAEFWPDALKRLKKAVETARPQPPKG